MKVNTLDAAQIRDKYADGNAKPYFKFYKNNEESEIVKNSKWGK